MNITAHHAHTPDWLAFASGAMKAAQNRQLPSCATEPEDDDPANDFLSTPCVLPPMIDLKEEWTTPTDAGEYARFCLKRPDRIGTTLHLLATLRLCATWGNRPTAERLCDPAAMTMLDVGHPDWIQPVTAAMQDLLPDHVLFHTPDERRSGELMILSPHPDDNLGKPKDAARFAATIRAALGRETPILVVNAGHRALPETVARILPPATRLAPIDADIILAMLHLRFEDGHPRLHAAFRRELPTADMLARLGIDAIHAAFRGTTGRDVVRTLAQQAAALTPTDGPTLDEMPDDSEAVTAARQIVADLELWAAGRLPWDDCIHSLLLHGQPGTGKTFLARAMGRSSGMPLVMSSFARWQACGHLGDALNAMIATFDEAIAAAPCILFIDEIDSAGSRDSGEKQNSGYRRQVINGLLEQIDVAMRAEGVVLVGACNNRAALDPAILRPGRFDMHVEVPLPGRGAIRAILQGQLGDALRGDDLDGLVTAAIGRTPAAIDAAIRGARSQARASGHPMQARDVLDRLTGGETPDRALMWRIAVHECGHAMLAVLRNLGPLRHVRLGPRDGNTALLPDLGAGEMRDHHAMLTYTLAGRAAEAVIFGSVGGGSGGPDQTCDLAFATRIARAMETSYGCGVDGLVWSPADSSSRITDPILRTRVRHRLELAETEARHTLQPHRVLLVEMAQDLMRHRVLDGPGLRLWIDRIVGHLPRDPGAPSEHPAAMDKTDSANVIDFARHRSGPS